MMKRNISLIAICVALAGFTLVGCSRFEEEDLFSESAALRIEHNAEKLQEILVNAPQGWVVQYYTGRGVSVFEGFNLFAKFDKGGMVTMAGNHRFLRDGNAGKYTEASSLYEVIREDGLVLAFNTWNDILTPFVDPVAPWAAPKNIVKDGAGMQGDQNLVVKSMKEDEIIFRGERYDAEVRMAKLDRDWQTYINDTETMRNLITNDVITSYYLVAGNDTLYCVGPRSGRYRIADRVNNPLKIDSVSCCFTPTGFRNEKADTLGGRRFQEFKLNEDRTALVNEDGTVQVIPTWDTYIVSVRSTTWNFDMDNFSEEQKSLVDQINTELQRAFNSTFNITSVGLGRGKTVSSSSPDPLILFNYSYKSSGKTKQASIGIAFQSTISSFGQMRIEISSDDSVDSNMKNFFEKSESDLAETLVRQFAATLSGTYDIIPNDYFLPTGCELHAVVGGIDYILQ